MTFEHCIHAISAWTGSWILIIYVLAVGLICTSALNFAQFRYFLRAWSYVLFPVQPTEQQSADSMTPLQAFINTLSANLGNGSIAGMATAIYSGGPGAAFWVLAAGFLLMSVRLAEVYLSIYYGSKTTQVGLGGPMLYLRSITGGRVLSYIYAVCCLCLGFLMGNALQTNSIRISLVKTWGISPTAIALVLLAFVWYVVSGGAGRIVRLSAKIVPFKVVLFFGSTVVVLIYHAHALPGALNLIITSAFHPLALAGGVLGFTVQQAMRFGILRSIFATESGLGTAAILFGSTGSNQAVKIGVMSMLSTFISTLGCFIISLCIIASGLWDSGLTSTALTIAVYETVFGAFAGWMVSFLSVSFGIGVMVVFAYITREAWQFLFGQQYARLFALAYCAVAVAGVLMEVHLLWAMSDIFIACMLAINLFGILYLLPVIRSGLRSYEQHAE
ncbi:MAG: alanine/glycine:cation symporter family protein [Candidatus Babeliales bacterium]